MIETKKSWIRARMKWVSWVGPKRKRVRWWKESIVARVSRCSEKARGIEDQKEKRGEQGREEEERGGGIFIFYFFYPSSLFLSPHFALSGADVLPSALFDALPPATLGSTHSRRRIRGKKGRKREGKRRERKEELPLTHFTLVKTARNAVEIIFPKYTDVMHPISIRGFALNWPPSWVSYKTT